MMIGKTLAFLVVLSVAAARDLSNVDPNSLSCDPLGLVHLLLPHFTDCNKYYICAHGREVEFSCPGTLIFDFVLQTCNWPRDTKCWLRSTEEDLDEGSGEQSGDFEWLVPFESSAPSRSADATSFSGLLDCSNARDAARQTPYKGDCQRYWRCFNGLPQSVYCSDGLFFNPRTLQCDFEANVICDVAHDEELQGEFMVY